MERWVVNPWKVERWVVGAEVQVMVVATDLVLEREPLHQFDRLRFSKIRRIPGGLPCSLVLEFRCIPVDNLHRVLWNNEQNYPYWNHNSRDCVAFRSTRNPNLSLCDCKPRGTLLYP